MQFLNRYSRWIFATLISVTVFVFFGSFHSEYLSYQEQNQLFQWTTDYFCECLSVAGGLADWIGECLTQFFYLPWLGAAIMGLLYVLIYVSSVKRGIADISAVLVSVLLLWWQSEPEAQISYMVALLLTLWAPHCRRLALLADILMIPLLYWLAGPLAWVYVGLRCTRLLTDKNAALRKMAVGGALFAPLWMLVCQLAAYSWLLPQYSLHRVMMGINYYRIPFHEPALQWVIPALVVACWLYRAKEASVANLPNKILFSSSLFILLTIVVGKWGFDRDTSELLKQAQMIRTENWDGIIRARRAA